MTWFLKLLFPRKKFSFLPHPTHYSSLTYKLTFGHSHTYTHKHTHTYTQTQAQAHSSHSLSLHGKLSREIDAAGEVSNAGEIEMYLIFD